jgi:2-desacetyl-2-hydroxyethyl bacteriochlorophyllide A dehydrogenase
MTSMLAPATLGHAAVVSAPGRVDLRMLEFREPAAGELRVQIEGCGVCASNLPIWEGKPWFEYPFEPGAPGHEAWGRVDKIGEGVRDFAAGDRVALLSSHAFAEYDFAPPSEVVRLPASVDNLAFPAEPLGCAINIFKRALIRSGETVAIVGVGFLGTLLTQLATNAGARVLALSHRRSSLKLAEQFGASALIEIDDDQRAVENVKQLTNGHGCECVIEAAGTQGSLDLASELTAERGRLVIAGYHQDGPRQVKMQLWNWRGIDIINAHERDPRVYVAGMRDAIAALESGVMDPRPLYTHSFPLKELSRAFETLESSPEGFVKALVYL